MSVLGVQGASGRLVYNRRLTKPGLVAESQSLGFATVRFYLPLKLSQAKYRDTNVERSFAVDGTEGVDVYGGHL
jgi:hypothetical protein